MDNKVGIIDMVLPAAITGFLGAIWASIPIANLCNICCAIPILMGAASALGLKTFKKVEIDLKTGAIVGAISGVVYAIVGVVISAILNIFGFGLSMAFADAGINILQGAGTLVLLAIGFAINLVIGIGFGALGGALAAKLSEPK